MPWPVAFMRSSAWPSEEGSVSWGCTSWSSLLYLGLEMCSFWGVCSEHNFLLCDTWATKTCVYYLQAYLLNPLKVYRPRLSARLKLPRKSQHWAEETARSVRALPRKQEHPYLHPQHPWETPRMPVTPSLGRDKREPLKFIYPASLVHSMSSRFSERLEK